MQTRNKRLKLTKQNDKMREIYGVDVNETQYCFSEHKLKALWNRPHINTFGTPKFIVVGIDPCNGAFKTTTKPTSKFAIISYIRNHGDVCITGFENIEARVPNDYVDVMLAHFRELQSRFPHSMFVVIVDGMTGMDAGRIESELKVGLVNNVIMVSTGNAKPGVLIGAEQKRDFMITMSELIDADKISFHKKITTSHPNWQQLKEEFLNQMCLFSQLKIKKDDAEPYTPVNIQFTGKLSKGVQDDLCVCFQMMVYYERYFYHSDKYRKYNL